MNQKELQSLQEVAMTTPRRKQICLNVTPYYHCVTRCVRRSFLCGDDHYTQKNFDHRRGWIEQLLIQLSEAFCIEIAAYAIMSNHYHVVLKVDEKLSLQLTEKEVVQRWLKIFKGNILAKKYIHGDAMTIEESQTLQNSINTWRSELANISRFMGQINEKIARWANKEDGCKGKFWESRFRCKAILDTNSLLQSMVYTDLNPIRANLETHPENSKYTSIHRRLSEKNDGLLPFKPESIITSDKLDECLPITLKEYVDLVDWSSRITKHDNGIVVAPNTPHILQRMQLTPKLWAKNFTTSNKREVKATGSAEKIREYCQALGQKWIWQNRKSIV